MTHLGNETVDITRLLLTEPVHSEDGLSVVRGIPGGVKDNYPVGTHQVDAQTSSPGGDQEETTPEGKNTYLVQLRNIHNTGG